MKNLIYLDYAATTPLDPRVRESMLECMDAEHGFGNPSSTTHGYGAQAAQHVERAANDVAELLNADPEEIIWTSGATESNNLALIGAARFRAMHGRHIVTTAIEHKSVLESCRWLETQGYEISYVEPDVTGVVAPAAIADALRPDTSMVSVMHANNETGVVQDIAAIGALCRARDLIFHVDAAQSLGKLPLDVKAQQIDMLSVNAHKACGPKGVGALYLNAARIRRVEPLLHGGGQQRGIRPGTLPVHQIVGMGAALRILQEEMGDEVLRIQKLRDRLWAGIQQIDGVLLNGDPSSRICSILNVSVEGLEGESLRFALTDLAISGGSACNSASGEPSYVLRSLGRDPQLAEASVRFSLGRFSTESEVDHAVKRFCSAVSLLRSLSPLARRA
jgi:cysteine desulfurase